MMRSTVLQCPRKIWGQEPCSAKCPVAARQVRGDETGLRSSWEVKSAGPSWAQQGTGPGTAWLQWRLGRNPGKSPSVDAAPKLSGAKGTPRRQLHHLRADLQHGQVRTKVGGRACRAQWYTRGPGICFVCSTNSAKNFEDYAITISRV